MSIKRLNEIAQTLDELSDEGPSELSALAEEMGVLLEALEGRLLRAEDVAQHAQRGNGDRMPRYLREINSIVQNEIRRTRGMHPDDPRMYMDDREIAYYEHARIRNAVLPPTSVFKAIGSIA